MSVYSIAVFLHIVGALGLFAALGIEWAGLRNLRGAATVGQVREALKLLAAPRRVGGPAALAILVTGVYMTFARWGNQWWIVLGLLGLVVMAVMGPTLSGRRIRAIAKSLPREDLPLSQTLGIRVRDPVLRLAACLRTALALGVVFLMSTKPDAIVGVSALGAAIALGLAAGSSLGSGRRLPAARSDAAGS